MRSETSIPTVGIIDDDQSTREVAECVPSDSDTGSAKYQNI